MNTAIAIAFFACSLAVHAKRNDLVYHYKRPSWKIEKNLDNSLPQPNVLNPDNVPNMLRDSKDTKVLFYELPSEIINKKSNYKDPDLYTDESDVSKVRKPKTGMDSQSSDGINEYVFQSESAETEAPETNCNTSTDSSPKDIDPPRNVPKKYNKRRPKKNHKVPNRAPYDPDIRGNTGDDILDILYPERPDTVEPSYHDEDFLDTGIAPPYIEALEDFDAAWDVIQNHFKREAFTYVETKDFRYVLIAVVIDGLSKGVSENGWAEYDNHYRDLVKSLMKKATVKPVKSVETIRCVFRIANDNIRRVRYLINNKWTKSVCIAQPSSCNAVIFTQLNSPSCKKNNRILNKEAKLLLKLGESASTFLQYYAGVFEAVSNMNAYEYLVNSKQVVRDLVKKNAAVRDILFPKGGPTEAECDIDEY